ncbi:hypothetical protein OIU76_012264, partial [Salix suchowensis]
METGLACSARGWGLLLTWCFSAFKSSSVFTVHLSILQFQESEINLTIWGDALSKYACSEEVPELQDMGGQIEGGFSVAFDPLDDPSIVDTNFSVGTIFGVWPGDKLTGVTGRDQVAAARVL